MPNLWANGLEIGYDVEGSGPPLVLLHGATSLARRHDAGQGIGAWQRLLPAIAADIAAQPLLTPAELHRIECPAMVVCGDRDPFVPPEHAAGLARRHDAGQGEDAWQRLLPSIAADIAAQPLLTPAELHRIECPAMVACGDRDPFVPPEHAAGLARQLPAGRLFVAPDCGHEVMSRRPGLFNEAIAGFYRSTGGSA